MDPDDTPLKVNGPLVHFTLFLLYASCVRFHSSSLLVLSDDYHYLIPHFMLPQFVTHL